MWKRIFSHFQEVTQIIADCLIWFIDSHTSWCKEGIMLKNETCKRSVSFWVKSVNKSHIPFKIPSALHRIAWGNGQHFATQLLFSSRHEVWGANALRNFCARFSDVMSRGNHWWHCKNVGCFPRLHITVQKEYLFNHRQKFHKKAIILHLPIITILLLDAVHCNGDKINCKQRFDNTLLEPLYMNLDALHWTISF